MSVIRSEGRFLALALAAAIFSGLIVGWSLRYWAVALAVCALSVVGIVWALTVRQICFDWRYIPVALAGFWPLAQILAGSTVTPALTARAAIVWGASGVAFVLASQILRRSRVRDRFLQLVLAGSVVLAIVAIVQKYAFPLRVFGVFPATSSVFGVFYYENQFAAFMEIAAPIALWRILRGEVVYGGVCYAILFAASIVSDSRAGVVLILVELVIFSIVAVSFRYFSPRASLSVIAMILVLTSIGALVVGTDYIRQRLESRVPETVRMELSKSTWRMIGERPWTGFGMGAWRPVYPRFASFDLALIANEAHDDWLQWAAEGGIPFFLLMAAIGLSLVKPAVRSIWGLGFPIVLAHSLVDYVLRAPALAFLWFAIGGALCQFGRGEDREAAHAAIFR